MTQVIKMSFMPHAAEVLPKGSPGVFAPGRLWSLLDMLHSYSPLYQIALSLQALRTTALFFKDSVHQHPPPSEVERFKALIEEVHQKCSEYGLDYTSDMAKRILNRPIPETYVAMFPELDHLNDSLSHELEKEAVFRVVPDHKGYYERDDLFGPKVAPRSHLASGTLGRREAATRWGRKMRVFITSCWYSNAA